MKKSTLLLWICSLILLSSCSSGSSGTYYIHYPKEPSPALTEYIRETISQSTENLLQTSGNQYTVSRQNGSSDQISAEYFSYTKDSLVSLYSPIIKGKNPAGGIEELLGNYEDELWTPIQDPLPINLPVLRLENGNQLAIQTKSSRKTFDLSQVSKQIIKPRDKVTINVIASNENGFVLELGVLEQEEILYLFALPSLTQVTLISEGDLENNVKSGFLKKYIPILVNNENSDYVLFNNLILSTANDSVVTVRNGDFASQDGQYIYLNGTDQGVTEGEQKIQTIKDYAESNDQYYAAFNLDYGAIAKELDLKTSGEPKTSIQYFNKDYVVIEMIYNGIIWGEAGTPTVIVDLQKNKEKPDFYLF